MKEFAIDTCVYIEFCRGDQPIGELIREADRICLCPVVVGEILSDLRSEESRRSGRNVFNDFCAMSGVEILPITQKTSEYYAIIYCWLRKEGRPIPINDMWIAAFAMEHALPLATNDPHFKKVPFIRLV